MKCTYCNSCLTLLRVDYELESKFYWYCPLCYTILEFSNKDNKIIDSDIENLVKQAYHKKYGTTL